MIVTILAGAGLFCLYLITGSCIGRWSLKIADKRQKSISSFILFPLSTFNGLITYSDEQLRNRYEAVALEPYALSMDPKPYIALLTFIWPIKLAWSSFIVIPTGLFVGLFKLGFAIGYLTDIESRRRTLKSWSYERFAKKLEKAKQLKLSAIDPMLDGYTRDDIETQMEEQRRIVEAETAKVETATAEYERLKKIHAATWSRG